MKDERGQSCEGPPEAGMTLKCCCLDSECGYLCGDSWQRPFPGELLGSCSEAGKREESFRNKQHSRKWQVERVVDPLLKINDNIRLLMHSSRDTTKYDGGLLVS
ncbi:hypothetical protein P171DRAFT_288368 [Karstenula rhodostoma CBS 690.94]|uniref:Uncharacterized protein n=1 Tax=Karstenula rhodostoma CBS 690.94 TaxID=1392251 RepID=A0A9P4PKX9_9PLEO|nr:hypothetical protein P171DRAFT_288368 [Karstenula rhodostoma CBS 690.94]